MSVVVIGGANVDHKSQMLAPPEFGTSNPGHSRTSPGGVGRNVAENLARLGVRTTLISAMGHDTDGIRLRHETELTGVDLRHSVTTDGPTGAYTAVLDASGEMVIAVSSMAVMDELTADVIDARREVIAQARVMVLDCNVPEDALLRVVAIARDERIPVVVDPVSVAKATRITAMLAAGLPIHTITPNRGELRVLAGMAQSDDDLGACVAPLHRSGVENVWVRLGPSGSFLSTMPHGRQEFRQLAPFRARLVDATGAGDAMLAGYVAGLVHGRDVAAAADYGRAAAAITVESTETVSPSMTFASVLERVSEHERSGTR